jgi:3-phosphoshikimate 1-carboxyvinyltransferase
MSDNVVIQPAGRVEGDIEMPGDKSISHRLAMIGSIADGVTTIHNFATSADSHSTLECLKTLQILSKEKHGTITIEGRGLAGLRQPTSVLDAQNSGTTVRMLSGILAACPLTATFVGDESLSRRPMRRIVNPLREFGATIEAREDNFLPLTIHGGHIKAIDYRLPVASAQVKSAVLLAGLHAEGRTRVSEPLQTRNHTEIALKRFGAAIDIDYEKIEVEGGHKLSGQTVTVPGDVSSAAFFIAATLGAGEGSLRIRGVGLNPTRTGLIHLLEDMGGQISIEGLRMEAGDCGEPLGDVIVRNSDLFGAEVRGHWIPNVIDEIPVLSVLGVRTKNGIRVREARELRSKESDRISAVVENLRALGVRVEEFEDGLFVPGNQEIQGGRVNSRGDHRIAMAFAVAGLFAKGPVTIENASCVDVSFPGFFELMRRVTF